MTPCKCGRVQLPPDAIQAVTPDGDLHTQEACWPAPAGAPRCSCGSFVLRPDDPDQAVVTIQGSHTQAACEPRRRWGRR